MALTCPDEASLQSLADALTASGVRHRAIVEAEGEHAGRLMAIGLAPERKTVLKKHLSMLPLLK